MLAVFVVLSVMVVAGLVVVPSVDEADGTSNTKRFCYEEDENTACFDKNSECKKAQRSDLDAISGCSKQ